LVSVSVHLLRARQDIELQRLWVYLAIQLLDLYLVRIDVCISKFPSICILKQFPLQGHHVKEIQVDPDRVPAFVMAEIAFTVTLTSSNNAISQMAAKGLRIIAALQRQPDAPQIDFIKPEDYARRARVYEQLGDPKVTVVGVYLLYYYQH
jgi:neurofibromin 1